MGKLRTAIENWIKAEYAFRLGPHAYQTKPADYMLEAEDALREVLTGESGLREAARSLGIRETTPPERRTLKRKHLKQKPPKPSGKTKSSPKSKPPRGLFF